MNIDSLFGDRCRYLSKFLLVVPADDEFILLVATTNIRFLFTYDSRIVEAFVMNARTEFPRRTCRGKEKCTNVNFVLLWVPNSQQVITFRGKIMCARISIALESVVPTVVAQLYS